MSEVRCSQTVFSSNHSYPCSRKGIVQSADKKYYCKQHLPETVKAKRAASQQAWDAEWKKKQEKWDAEAVEKIARQKLLEVYRAGGLHGSVYEMVRAWEKTVKEVESYG